MSLTQDLNVYKAMYNLSLKLCDARNRFDKPYKYCIGDKIIDKSTICLALIHYANEDRRQGAREQHLAKFLIEFDILKTYILICRDRAQFKKISMLADVLERAAEVEKQITSWRKASRA
jgi:hypothetical protein